jgi:nicotinamidase-related amidase
VKKLLIIDPQNDFCDIAGAALPVAGASQDMDRLAGFIADHLASLDGITVTLDSHASVAVERTPFWMSASGDPVAPFTFITEADVVAGTWKPRNAGHTPAVLAMLRQLAQRGRPGLVVWPVHCVTGTWGHNIHGAVAAQLQAWEMAHQTSVRKVLKGEYPLSEHFGVFEADAPDAGVPSTLFNSALARDLTEGVSLLLLAGEASSHCVAASFDQLTRYLDQQPGARPRIVVLSDCMSPVTGFEGLAEAFLQRAQAWGAQVMRSGDAAELL